MNQLPDDAVKALFALKAQQHYATILLEDEQREAKPKGVFSLDGSDTKVRGTSGKGKSLLPRVGLREAQQDMERYEPHTTKIAQAILKDSQITIETADEDWLRTQFANL